MSAEYAVALVECARIAVVVLGVIAGELLVISIGVWVRR